jgi:hypothetical protein
LRVFYGNFDTFRHDTMVFSPDEMPTRCAVEFDRLDPRRQLII